MPAIQVKDCPQDIYDQLKAHAARDDRSLTQEMIAIFKWYFANQNQPAESVVQGTTIPFPASKPEGHSPYAETYSSDRASRRKAVLDRICDLSGYSPAGDGKTAADLLRESREEAR